MKSSLLSIVAAVLEFLRVKYFYVLRVRSRFDEQERFLMFEEKLHSEIETRNHVYSEPRYVFKQSPQTTFTYDMCHIKHFEISLAVLLERFRNVCDNVSDKIEMLGNSERKGLKFHGEFIPPVNSPIRFDTTGTKGISIFRVNFFGRSLFVWKYRASCFPNFQRASFSSLFDDRRKKEKSGRSLANEALPDVAISLEPTSWHVEWQIMVHKEDPLLSCGDLAVEKSNVAKQHDNVRALDPRYFHDISNESGVSGARFEGKER